MTNIINFSRPPLFWIGVALIVAVFFAGTAWLFWPQKAVLFSDLTAEDAAQITTQLDKQKLPYTLSRDGSTITMAPELVPKARLQVFSDQLSLKSGVGLELFSGNDLGMTEFSQHVNYVRALQGELTRTLLTIEGVDSARVHVAMPEGGGRRLQQPVKVAITLNSSAAVSAQTVNGVQRFVTAAVPGVSAADVVIVDGKGNLLTRAQMSQPEEGGLNLGSQLEQKAAIEAYLEKKAAKLLRSIALPPARAEVIVDVSLSDRRRNVTREELLPAGSLRGVPVGLLQKAHFGPHQQNAKAPAEADGKDAVAATPLPADEVYEFSNGKQIEHIENPAGAIEKISLSVVVVGVLPLHAEEALQRSLSRGLGLNPKRGDEIAVLVMPAPVEKTNTVAPVTVTSSAAVSAAPAVQAPARQEIWFVVATMTLLIAGALLLCLFSRRRQNPDALAEELRQLLQETETKTV